MTTKYRATLLPHEEGVTIDAVAMEPEGIEHSLLEVYPGSPDAPMSDIALRDMIENMLGSLGCEDPSCVEVEDLR